MVNLKINVFIQPATANAHHQSDDQVLLSQISAKMLVRDLWSARTQGQILSTVHVVELTIDLKRGTCC